MESIRLSSIRTASLQTDHDRALFPLLSFCIRSAVCLERCCPDRGQSNALHFSTMITRYVLFVLIIFHRPSTPNAPSFSWLCFLLFFVCRIDIYLTFPLQPTP